MPQFEPLQVQRIVQTGSVSFDVPCGALRKDRAYTQIGPMLKGYPADTLEEHLSDEAQTFAWKPSCHAAEDTAQITLENSYATCRFPYNATGFLCMTVECAQACTVYLLFDEILTDGDVDFLRLTNCNCFKYDLDAGTHRIMTFAPYTMMYLKIAAKGACRVSEVRMLQYQHPAPEAQTPPPYPGNEYWTESPNSHIPAECAGFVYGLPLPRAGRMALRQLLYRAHGACADRPMHGRKSISGELPAGRAICASPGRHAADVLSGRPL